MNPVFVSTSVLRGSRPILEILERYQAVGIDAVELGSGHPASPEILDRLQKFDFTYGVHNYFPQTDPDHLINIASQDPIKLAKTIDIAKQAILLCHMLGGYFYGIHAGYRSDPATNSLGRKLIFGGISPHEVAFQTMVTTIRELCDFARSFNIGVSVENHVLAANNLVDGENKLLLLCSADEIMKFAREVDRENFGILVDVGHLKVTANTLGFDPFAFVQEISPWIRLFHLSDNDGFSDLALPFTEHAWFAPIIKQFPTVPCVIETSVDNETLLLQEVEIVKGWTQNGLQGHP